MIFRVLTRNRAHTHNDRDKMNPPVAHFRRIIAIVGMQAEAHDDSCTVRSLSRMRLSHARHARHTRHTRIEYPSQPRWIDSLVEEAVL